MALGLPAKTTKFLLTSLSINARKYQYHVYQQVDAATGQHVLTAKYC